MTKAGLDPVERVWLRIQVTDSGCWEFTGSCDPHGYGRITVAKKQRGAHIIVWETHRGLVPDGLELDHLCRNPPCCNPDHLEPVTHKINTVRGLNPKMIAHANGTCVAGHPQAEHAVFRRSTGRVVYCKACRRERRSNVTQ